MRTRRIASTHSASAVGVSRGGNPKRRPCNSVALLRRGSFARGSLSCPRRFTLLDTIPCEEKVQKNYTYPDHTPCWTGVSGWGRVVSQGCQEVAELDNAHAPRPSGMATLDGAIRSGYRAADEIINS